MIFFQVKIIPIFSAEGTQYRVGIDSFMGDWLSQINMQVAQNIFESNWNASQLGNSGALIGYQYYEYVFMKLYNIKYTNESTITTLSISATTITVTNLSVTVTAGSGQSYKER